MATKSDTEIFEILGEWKRLRQEGVTQKRFCDERGISERTLRSWVERNEPQAQTPAELITNAQAMIDELQRMIERLREAEPPVHREWQRWVFDAACRSAIKP
jgi:Transposase